MIRNYSVDKMRDEIRDDIAASKLLDDDSAQHLARTVLAGLQRRYGGGKLYIPVDFARAYPVKDILQAYARGDSVRTVCRRYHITHSTFYRLLGAD